MNAVNVKQTAECERRERNISRYLIGNIRFINFGARVASVLHTH